ncbi:MAG: hypothetical protein CMI01_06950 [Oceanospirillaceae bacterium]|jgi:hypothetical protein|uniref:hypothetical protein n=1 Tax=Marinobacterium litorale TaxID=404770 RepID=UPI0004247826|nr:hypothetical protein [Marinobacterium litorale]MBS98400.1 hypothetical protein [Oceanospirillaceae bacterium]
MSTPVIIIGVVLLVAVVAFWQHQRTSAHKQSLANAGFERSESLGGSPEILIDEQGSEIALVGVSDLQRFAFERLRGIEVTHKDRPESEGTYGITLQVEGLPDQAVHFGDEWQARRVRERLLPFVKDR